MSRHQQNQYDRTQYSYQCFCHIRAYHMCDCQTLAARQHAITLMLRMPGTHKEDGARVFPEITETMDDESRRALKATGWLSGFRYKQDINLLVFLLSA